MDLVKIGFIVTANGLKEANAEVDKLLSRVDKIGSSSKKNASEFENSQQKIKKTTEDSTKATDNNTKATNTNTKASDTNAKANDAKTKAVEKTTKALERQRMIGEYLGQGLDKSTATSLTNFRQLKAGAIDTNTMFTLLGNNSALNTANRQAKAVNDSLVRMRMNLDFVGKGFSASEQAQLRQMKLNGATNAQLEEAIRLLKQKKQAEVLADYKNQKPALQREWLAAYDKEIAARVTKQQEAIDKVKNIVSGFEAKSRQSFGGGILDTVDRQNKALSDMAKYYSNIERLQNKAEQAEKAAQERVTKNAEKERQKQLAAAERARQAELRGQSGTSTGRDVIGQIKGIAAYALLSTAIYGVMTATFNLIGATIKMADEYTSTQQRLKLYIKDSETLGQVNTFLAKTAIQNNVGLRENAALYAKLSPAMQRIGANIAATNQVVDAFGKSLRIGGATAMEAASATIQFAQAMASGKLAGDEFRAISEASPRFLKAIADGSGIAAEKLKEMSSAGALTTEVIARALVKEYHNLTRESESLGYTLEQGTNALKTGFMSLIGEFNEGAGITKYLGSLMADLGVSMIDGAKAAKENGEAVKVWFLQNADNISMVVDMFKLLATVIISRYAVAIVLARVESVRYQSALLTMAAAQAGVTRSTLAMTTALTVAGNAMKGLLAFFGGWVGLALTVAGTVASYVMFNKEAEKTTKSLREEGETIEDTVAKYKELTAVQRDKALLDERKNVEATTKSYQDQKSALVANVLQMSRHNDVTDLQAQTLGKLGLWYKEGKINLDQLNGAIKNSTFLSQESKDKFITLASGVSEADKKAASASKVLEALGLAAKGAGDEADIAGSKFNKFLTDAETQININKLAAQYMVKYNLDQAKAVDLAKQALALQAQKKDITPAEIKSQQELLKSETALANITKDRNKADKDSDKLRKKSEKNLEKFNDQLLESQTYYDILKRTNNLEVARIASQKEYISIYKGNLAVATQLAAIQEKTRKEESRQEYSKSLKNQIEQLDVIAGLTAAGADYETAKALAAAGFANDSRGRLAAEKTLMNTLTGQSYALSDQITEQETLNRYLKEGMGIEEARFKVALSRIAKLSGGKNVFGEFGEDFENSMKTLRVRRATEASQIKINSILRESGILTKAMEMGYTTSNIAVSKLAGATQGLLFSQAETQLKQQDELDLLYENAKARVKINSLLSGESEALRAVKEDYVTIGDFEAERAVQLRKSLELAESYANKMKEQKANPLGDFSNVDFEVFGSFGNPFKEALDGLNSLISGSTKLDESLAIVAAQISELQAQAFVEDMFGNQTAVESLNSQVEKQVALEKDLQKQKAETNDIAYGQGLKFAKTFFKENSKGYKALTTLEQVQQGIRIALAIEEAATKIGLVKTTTLATMAANAKQQISEGITAAVSSMKGLPFPYNIAAMGATIAAIAGLGVAIGGGGSSGSFAPTNEGTGTVFGDTEAKSSSIKNSIELLSNNSDLMLPLTSAMLASLKNIESSIGGVTNLIIRQATGGGFNVQEGFKQNTAGKLVGGVGQIALGGVGAVGGALGGAFASGLLGASAGSALGIGLGIATGGIGLLLGSVLGKALGGLFGSKTTIKGQGLYGASQDLGSILSQGFDLQEYVDIQTKKKAFGITTSKKNSTKYSAANQELENQFSLIFTGFYDSIVAASGALSANTDEVKKKLQESVIDLGKIDLKGLNGEQIQEKLEAVFGAAADDLARQGFAGLDDFQKVGEGYYETLIRVASSVEQASYYTDRLNVSAIKYTDILNKQGDVAAEIVRQSVLLNNSTKNIKGGFYDLVNTFEGSAEELTNFIFTLRDLQDQLFMTGKDADYLTSAMILGAGGLDSLSNGLDAYFEMLSPAEQAAELTRRLTNEFELIGKTLPSDVKAFRALVNSIDITTEAGQKLYGQVIALAPEFNDLQDSLKNANSEVNALVQSLRDLAEQSRAARGETEQPRNLAYTRSQFEQASVLAMQGDIASAEKLLTLGKDLMGLSKTYSVSGSEYARDLALIQRAATVSADIQEQGLGTSISTTLTPSSGTTTTPIVNTNNTSTDAKLDALSEKLEAGLFAIAKYTQDSASRLERWDDGGRMMVGIQPENGDQPIPVKVVP